MALATRCPHCHTTFRVAHDQLKLRAGLVRCGACKEIFNGIEHLLRPDQPAPASSPASQAEPPVQHALSPAEQPAPAIPDAEPASSAPSGPDPESAASDQTAAPAHPVVEFIDFFNAFQPAKAMPQPPTGQAEQAPDALADPNENDPLQRMTLMDFSDDESEGDDPAQPGSVDDPASGSNLPAAKDADASDPIAQAIDELQRKPLRRAANELSFDGADTSDNTESEEPSFVTHGRRKKEIGRMIRILMGIGSAVLLLGVIVQSLYAFRAQIAVLFPPAKPMLVQACSVLACRVDLPAQIDAVSIESSELQTLAPAPDTFVLNTLLRNRGATVQAWPNIELTLNDANDKAIARRVFTPREYLPSTQDPSKGFAAASEQSVKLFFELSQLKPLGYRVYLFYP
jgi:predicted Zn finger-like uncharacterized protein